MIASKGGAGERSDTLLPGKAGGAAAVRRTLATTICRAIGPMVTLARLHRAGELTGVWVPDAVHEAVRDLVRAREAAADDLRRKRQQLLSFLLRHGRIYTASGHWTLAHRRWLAKQAFDHAAQQIVFQEGLEAIEDAAQRLRRLEQQLALIAPSWSMAPVVEAYQAMRGASFLVAVTFAAEIGDVRRFETPRQLMSFLGLVPAESSTGDTVRRKGLTLAGNRRARRVLVEAAWTYRYPARVSETLRARGGGLPKAVRDIAWKAQVRLCARRQGAVMSGFLTFMDGYRDEAECIAGLAQVRWPNGFVCAGCAGRTAYQLAVRPRVFECAGCGRQHSVTAGTVFHRTRTPLRKWFAAAWLIAQDKRGVSALFLARELALRYDTAWLMAHKLRHGLSERPEYPLDGLIEIDESYYGGRGKPASRGRGLADPNKSLMAIAVETVPATPRQGEGIKKSRFVAGSARIAVLPSATAADLGGFVRGAAKPGARIITDGLKSYDALADSFRHYSIVQDGGKNADAVLPIVHVLFSNLKTWLNGTFHGVSAKHLPRYAREWNYRFNRRRRIADLTDFLLRRAVTRSTITYRQLVDGAQLSGALPALTG